MSDNDWYFVSFNIRTAEKPPLDAWEFIRWLRGTEPIVFDNIRLVQPVTPRVLDRHSGLIVEVRRHLKVKKRTDG